MKKKRSVLSLIFGGAMILSLLQGTLSVNAAELSSQEVSEQETIEEEVTEAAEQEVVLDVTIYAKSLQEGYLYSTYIGGDDDIDVLKGEESWRTGLKQRFTDAIKSYQKDINVRDLDVPWTSDDTVFETLEEVLREVLDANPDFFYVAYISGIGGTGAGASGKVNQITICYDESFTDDAGNVDINKINTYTVKLSQALSCVKSEMTNVEKLLAVHDYLVVNCTYDYENYLKGTIPDVAYTAYGALVNGKAVCNGYALAMADLIKHMGMSCYVVGNNSHAWNMVYVDGNWYHIDATWDDPVWTTGNDDNYEGYVEHEYFLLSDAEIKALDSYSHGNWRMEWGYSTIPQATNSNSYADYIFRDEALESSAWYYNGEWYFISCDAWKSSVAKAKINGTELTVMEELGNCQFAQIKDDYLFYVRQADYNDETSYMDGIYALKLGGDYEPERVMTMLVNKGYIDYAIEEFAIYNNIIAVVMSHVDNGNCVRLEYLTSRRETEDLPTLKILEQPAQKNYPNNESSILLDGLKLALVYADGTKLTVKPDSKYAALQKGENYVCDVEVSHWGLTARYQVTNNPEWPIHDIFSTSSNWVYNAAKYVYDEGIMKGTSNTTFEPDKKLERCMLAQILYNMEDKPEVTYHDEFVDVPEGQWYSNAITWAYDNEIVKGYDEDTFGTYDYITREQLAIMLMKYAKLQGIKTDERADISGYVDADKVSSWAEDAIEWAVASGVMKGKGDKLDPLGNATRAEGAAMIKNFCEKVQ